MIAEKDRDKLLQIAGAIAPEVLAIPYNINLNSKQIAAIAVGIAVCIFNEVDNIILQGAKNTEQLLQTDSTQ